MNAREVLPRTLPSAWWEVEERADGVAYQCADGVRVIASVEHHPDKWWLHVSLSRTDKLPSWDDLKSVKDLFIGRAKTALQVLPPEEKYVNQCPYCLHLWHCLDGDVTPDFTKGSGML